MSSGPSPEVYEREFIAKIELIRVRLVQGSIEALNPSPEAGKLDFQTAFDFKPTPEGFEAIATCRIKFFNGESRNVAGTVSCTFALEYECAISFAKLRTQGFLDVFESLNLPFNAWPFWREFMLNATARMDWPKLTLPLLKSPLEEMPSARKRKRRVVLGNED